MDKMMNDVDLWRKDPEAYMNGQGLNKEMKTLTADKGVFVLIVEGFLIFNYGYIREDWWNECDWIHVWMYIFGSFQRNISLLWTYVLLYFMLFIVEIG